MRWLYALSNTHPKVCNSPKSPHQTRYLQTKISLLSSTFSLTLSYMYSSSLSLSLSHAQLFSTAFEAPTIFHVTTIFFFFLI